MVLSWVCLVALGGSMQSREPLLLDVAKLVTPVGSWVEGQITVGEYRWWTPNRILVFYSDNEDRLMDTATKVMTPFDASALRRHGGPLSPDNAKVVRQTWKDRT